MNARRRATIDQQKTIRVLEAAGYVATRVADSSAFDVVGVSASDVILVRVT